MAKGAGQNIKLLEASIDGLMSTSNKRFYHLLRSTPIEALVGEINVHSLPLVALIGFDALIF